MGLTELETYIPNLITAIGQFLNSGIMFYIMGILVFAIVVDTFINFIRRK